MKICKVLLGVSGSGKSTFARKLLGICPMAAGMYGVIVSADKYFEQTGTYVFNADKLGAAHGQCWAQFADEITKGCSLVIVDNTNLVYKDLKKYYEFATSAGYDVEIVAVECLPEIAAARNVHNVPEKTILKMAARFQTCLNHVKANGWKLHVIQGSSPGEQAITS